MARVREWTACICSALPRSDLRTVLTRTAATRESSDEHPAPPIPRSFGQYLRSFGPGLVAVLTWLGAGDVVEAVSPVATTATR
jgi:hypothetical protein